MDGRFSVDQPAKTKVYEAPKLVRYGGLVEVTRNIAGGKGKNDNAKGKNKT
jgi:hypothetical protein